MLTDAWHALVAGGLAAPVFLQPREPEVEATFALARELGLGVELIDFADPPGLTEEGAERGAREARLRRLLDEHPGRVAYHGAYLDVYVNSPDPLIRAASERRIELDLDSAERLGAEWTLFHTNHLPCTTKREYTLAWIERTSTYWGRVAPARRTRVLLENMWDEGPELLDAVTRRVPELGICLDVAHARVFGKAPLEQWLRVLGSRVEYVHVSDNDGVADAALPPGRGDYDWERFDALVRRYAPAAAVMMGVGHAGLDAAREGLAHLAAHGLHPFPRAQATPAGS